ncbi:hypothetical protein ACX27_07830 [Nostoc piscinale CENA21]|uniref:Replication origin-binding protein domain-containing protein n=1 Tax=Nostoc piscinale CENA21 TaxID=224013 RepID=A0A0M5MGH6_9NOSO|nr:hypothetical protein [Nostoc piscinale]ALF52788.1 hypothetical protein ACX27_07830 [Nostoc piscinale CENA21]
MKSFFTANDYKFYSFENFSDERWSEIKKVLSSKKLSIFKKEIEIKRLLNLDEQNPPKNVQCQRKTNASTESNANSSDSTVPLIRLCSYEVQTLIKDGVKEGGRNQDAFKVAAEVIAVENWAKGNNSLNMAVEVSGTARELYAGYCQNCDPALDGSEAEAVWKSASARDLKPSRINDEDGNDGFLWSIVAGDDPELLNKLIVRPKWHHITDCSIKKPWGGFEYDPKVLEKIPPQGILILKAPMGGGKTKLIDVLINEIYRDSRVVSVTPTIALNEVLGNRLKIDIRDDVEAMGFDPKLIEKIGFVCPSLWKLLGRDYGNHSIAILDEFRQSLSFLTQSKECDTYSPRSQNIKALNEVCRNSDIIILSDAYITNVEADYITNLRPDLPVYVLEIPTYTRDREIWEITNEAKNYQLIDQLLEEGKSLIIPCDSQRTGEALDEIYTTKSIEERYQKQGFKTFRLDRETKGGREQELFLNNPTEYIKAHPEIRLFIFSPTLGSGASIEDGHFDAMVALNTHLTPTDFLQMVGRYRLQIPLYYWSSSDKPNRSDWSKSHYPSEHKKSFFDSVDRLTDVAKIQSPEPTPDAIADELRRIARAGLEGQSPILDLICKQRARHNYLSCKRRDKLREQFSSDGYTVDSFDAEGKEIDSSFLGDKREATKQILLKKAVAIIEAPLVNEAEGEKLLNKKVLITPSERIKAEKYKFNKMLPGFLGSIKDESEAIEFYYRHLKDGGRWVSSVFARWRWENRELLKAQDIKSLERLLGQFKDSGTDSLVI